MKLYKDYRRLEKVYELRVYDFVEKELYQPSPLEFIVDDVPFPQLISNVPMDVNILIPHNDGNDFIIKSVGNFILDAENLQLDDVRGRLLSKISPAFYEMFHEYFHEVYKTQETIEVHVFYYGAEKLSKITIVKILYEMNRLFVFADHINTDPIIPDEFKQIQYSEDKVSMMEYFTQTGSYRKVDGKYTWTQGTMKTLSESELMTVH